MVEDAGPTYDLMRELTLLDPAHLQLYRNDLEEVYLRRDGEAPVGPLTVQRAFPITCADDFISLKQADDEIGIIRRLAELDDASRAVVEEELEWTYFAATITAVRNVEVRFHIPHWDVETDRGPRVFELRSSRRDIRILPGGRVLIRDADGNRYEIPDVRRLDPASTAVIEDYV